MPAFSSLKSLYQRPNGSVNTPGQLRLEQSRHILEHTWDGSPQRKTAYLYDAFHDSEPTLPAGLHPSKDALKTPVSIHFISHSIPIFPGYHDDPYNPPGPHHHYEPEVCYIQFRPSYRCTVNYYQEAFGRRYGAEFPVGLYMDIPDAGGIYRRWLITGAEACRQTLCPLYRVEPVTCRLPWVEDGGKERLLRQMWAVERGLPSCCEETSAGQVFARMENRTSVWLPMNPVTQRLSYDQRLILSAPSDTPLTWSVTRVENTRPLGLLRLTLSQTSFDSHRDYADPKTGEMYADYYASAIIPHTPENLYATCRGRIQASSGKLRIGGGYKTLQAVWTDTGSRTADEISLLPEDWSFCINGEDASPLVSIIPISEYGSANSIRLKFIGDSSYLTQKLLVCATDPVSGIRLSRELEIMSL